MTVTDITTQTQTTVAYAGEIQITAEAPVTVEDGKVTETLAKKLPDVIWIATGDFPELYRRVARSKRPIR